MALEAYAQQIIDFTRQHGALASPIAFALAFGESLAFISLLVPAWTVLVAIGALVGVSGIGFWPTWIAISMGAALGDSLSYWIGLKLGKSCLPHVAVGKSSLFGSEGETFVKKWGVWHFRRSILRATAIDCSARCRYLRDALLAVSIRQFCLCLCLGYCGTASRQTRI